MTIILQQETEKRRYIKLSIRTCLVHTRNTQQGGDPLSLLRIPRSVFGDLSVSLMILEYTQIVIGDPLRFVEIPYEARRSPKI